MDVKKDVNNFLARMHRVVSNSIKSAEVIVERYTGLNPFNSRLDKKVTLTRKQLRSMVHESIMYGYILHSEKMDGGQKSKLSQHIYDELIKKCDVDSDEFYRTLSEVKNKEIEDVKKDD